MLPVVQTDPTMIAPPKKQRSSLTNVSWLHDTTEGWLYEKRILMYFLARIKLSNDDVGEGGNEHRISGDKAGIIGAGFKTGDFVKRKVGGVSVERLYLP